MIRIGIDIGSTTVKVVALDETDRILFSKYERHHARAKEILIILLQELQAKVGDREIRLKITGSVGMGFAERYAFDFIQEVF